MNIIKTFFGSPWLRYFFLLSIMCSSTIECKNIQENYKNSENLTIQKIGNDNPNLYYKGAPLLAVGSISENRIFMHKWGSAYYDHEAWLDWMKKNGFKIARVYPNSVWYAMQAEDIKENRLYPFKLVGEKNSHPKVDLMRMDEDHWKNFAKILYESEQREIIVVIQLYQRWYFENSTKKGIKHGFGLFYDSKHNVNGVNEFSSQKFWQNTVKDHKDHNYGRSGMLWKIHENWVNAILNSIKGTYAKDFGNKNGRKNVIIDLMNEGSIKEGVSKEWINKTLDIIKKWELENHRDILVGMDMDHVWARDYEDDIKWVMRHPDMELIIGEDHWIYEIDTIKEEYKNIIDIRKKYNKPILWMNEKDTDYSDTMTITDYPNRRRHYMWLGLMLKVQGLAMYEKRNATKDRLLETPQAVELAKYNMNLMDFFLRIRDYSKLQVDNNKISHSPIPNVPSKGEVKPVRVCLASDEEAIVYLHDHWGSKNKGGILKLKDLDPALNGTINVNIIHLVDNKIVKLTEEITRGAITIKLPEYYENLVVYLYK